MPQGQFLSAATPILLTHSALPKTAIAESIVSDPTVQVSEHSLADAGLWMAVVKAGFS